MYFFTLMSREFLSSTVALIAAKTANDFFIVYLRNVLAGRFFGIRTILSTVIGEIIMLELDYNYSFHGLKSWSAEMLSRATFAVKTCQFLDQFFPRFPDIG